MRAVRLVAVSDEYDDKPGLAIKGAYRGEGFAADRDGLLIAHDLLEHQNGPEHIGPVWDELEALGAIWQVRGRHGDLQNGSMHSPDENLASDVARMSSEWAADGLPPKRFQFRTTRPCDYDDDFDEIIEIARRSIIREWHDDIDRLGQVTEYLTAAKHRMRIGYRKAVRRFGHCSFGYDQFAAIKRAVGPACVDPFEGQEFVLCYGGGEATIREVNHEWE